MHILMKDIQKSFGQNQVLKNAQLDLRDGEVHALMGENGAGKSTLMNILTGVYTKDSGSVFVDDKEVTFKSAKEAEENGIVFIHQELNVLYDMTVEENLFINKELKGSFGFCRSKEMQEKAKEALALLGVSIPAKAVMSTLSVGQQQMVEICKGLMANARVIIMDEPTAALTETEANTLFEVIEGLREKGVSVIYISHRMEEIFQISDRITVMRDGEYIGTKDTKDTNMNELVKMMIGREIGERYPARQAKIGDVVLEVEGLGLDGVFDKISFNVRAGEVLGVGGLMGAGRTEIMHSIFGDVPYQRGKIRIRGKEVQIRKTSDAIKQGIGFITEDRKLEGLMLEKSIEENISLTNLDRMSHNTMINTKKEDALSQRGIKEFNIKCFGASMPAGNLSGGNQQKVVLAKWILKEPKILILDEPTRGVDIGAKKEIYNIINDLAGQGVAVIMISSELPELLGMSDRIMVVREGRVTGIISKEEANQENVMILATGGTLDENEK
ncbi:MAG TPA: sugar ABC transporter ATP-binding protein [Candidatus Choladousia intestinavium]|uniref:Sugar ABC transporter ATP-binding protein n=1 Tax=Candidatus Choladousia intestinavium TaxID=2840727 RepID=A0A9D1AEH0_9FIRM|nr:sugar ABC transporter ATP-binding protein [Candidatus Choladousia intestinavium]